MKHSITCFCKFFVILIMTFSLYGCKNYDVEPFYDGIYTVKTINGIDDEDIFNQNTTIEISHELLSYEVDYRNDIGTWHHMSLYLSDDVYLIHYHLTWNNCYFENCSGTECIAGCIYLNNECDVFSNSEDILFKNLSGLGMFLRFYESGRDYFAELAFTPSGYESMFYTFVLNV